MLKAITRKSALIDAKVREYNNDILNNKEASNTSKGGTSEVKAPISVAWYFDHVATAEDIAVTVSEADFRAAKAELIPSVSAEELAYYEKVKETFEGLKVEKGNARSDAGDGGGASSREQGLNYSVKGKGKGKGKEKAIEIDRDGQNGPALTLRPRPDFDGVDETSATVNGNGVDSSVGNSSGKGKGKGKARMFMDTDGASATYADVTKNKKDDESPTARQTTKHNKNSSMDVKGGYVENRKKDDAAAAAFDAAKKGVRAGVGTNADVDSDSDNGDFDDAQSKISRVNGLSRSASDAGSNVGSDSSSAEG